MPPRQSFQPPSQPQQPRRDFTPQAPHYGYGSAIPGHSPSAQHFQRHESGHYEVVPTPQPVQNDGHSGHNAYDFIVNPNAQTRPGLNFALLGGSLLTRIALLGGALVVIIIVASLVISALSPKSVTPELISLAQRQQEIIRVSTGAVQQATGSDTKNFATNVEASVTTDQVQITTYLASHGKKLNGKILARDQSAQTDSQLTDAATANNYDSAVTQNLIDQLQTYESQLQTTFGETHSTVVKATLQGSFNSADMLIKQGRALQAEFGS